MDMNFLKWIGHASFLIKNKGMNLYIDPFRLGDKVERADLILITHPHFDHLSVDDIGKIADSNTEVFVPKDSIDKIKWGRVVGVEPNRSYSSNGIEFGTIPAYNVVNERLRHHPIGNGWVGYILDVDGKKIYHAGDTDFVEEMKKIEVDLALLPMGGTYTMSLKEAVGAARSIDAKNVAPMHYKALLGRDGSIKAEDEFKKNVENSIILKETQEPFYAF